MTKPKNVLTRDAILQAPDLALTKVDMPEWGGAVYVRGLTGTERDRFEVEVLGSTGKDRLKNARAKLVVLGTVDEEGNLLFAESDIEALGKKNSKALDRLFQVIRRESGLLDEDIDELVKNFVSDLKGDSTSS